MPFVKGQKTGIGRPKGLQNKVTQTANEAFDLAFQGLGGVAALTRWAAKNKTDFYKIFGRRIKTEIATQVEGEIVVRWEGDVVSPESDKVG